MPSATRDILPGEPKAINHVFRDITKLVSL